MYDDEDAILEQYIIKYPIILIQWAALINTSELMWQGTANSTNETAQEINKSKSNADTTNKLN